MKVNGTTPPHLLSARQVAETLGVSVTLVYSLCESGQLAAHRIGTAKNKRYKIDSASLDRYLQNSLVKPVGEVERERRAVELDRGGFSLLKAAGRKG